MPRIVRTSRTVLWSSSGSDDWLGRIVMVDAGAWWLCVYRSDVSHGPNTTGKLHIRFSDDEGVTWSDEDTNLSAGAVAGFPVTPTATFDVADPLLIPCPNGDVLLHVLEKITGTRNGTIQYRSTDDGLTWSSEGQINSDATLLGGQDYFLDGSTIYASFWVDAGANETAPYKSVLYSSSDNGTTWTLVGDITSTTEDTNEVGIEKIGATTFLAVCRATSNATTYTSISTDSGANWTPTAHLSPFNILQRPRLRYFGSRLLCWGRQKFGSSATGGLTGVYYSDDDGTTWHGPFFPDWRVADDTGYGDLLQRADGSYYMLVYCGTTDAAPIIALEWEFDTSSGSVECGTFVSGKVATDAVVVPLSRFAAAPKAVLFSVAAANMEQVAGTACTLAFGATDGTTQAYVALAAAPAASTTFKRHSAAASCGFMSGASGTLLQEFTAALAAAAITATFGTDGVSSAPPYRFMALGGAALQANLVAYAANTSTGNQALTGAGFQPTAAIIFGSSDAAASPSTVATSQMFVAITDGTTSKVLGAYSQNGVATHNTWQRLTDGVYTTLASTGEVDHASFVSFDADGMTINWDNAPSTAHNFYVLYLAGIDITVGTITQPTSAGDQTISPVGYVEGLLTLTGMAAANAGDQSSMQPAIGFSDCDHNVLSGACDEDAQSGNTSQVGFHTKSLGSVSYADALTAQGRVTAGGQDNISITWDSADATQRETVYMSFGRAPGSVGIRRLAMSRGGVFRPVEIGRQGTQVI